MKEESKYYTPKIEEFHVGFEYELHVKDLHMSSDSWNKETCYVGGFNALKMQECIKRDLIRVKHLNREDIESLEFAFLPNPNVDWIDVYSIKSNNSEYSLTQTKSSRILIDKHLESGNMAKLFNGTVNNKSELQRVLKMVGI